MPKEKKYDFCESNFTEIDKNPYEYVWDDAVEYDGRTYGSSQIADAIADYLLATAAF